METTGRVEDLYKPGSPKLETAGGFVASLLSAERDPLVRQGFDGLWASGGECEKQSSLTDASAKTLLKVGQEQQLRAYASRDVIIESLRGLGP